MKQSFNALLLALAGNAAAQYSVRFGPYYSLGATTSYIVEAETTMYPGKTPDPSKDRLALWPGMGTDSGALIQSIVWSGADPNAECGAETGEWCTFASVYDTDQTSGKEVPLSASQGVKVNYKYDETTGNYTQTVSINGEVVSTLESSSGKAIGWGTTVECQDACTGYINAHTYENTTITLAEADTAFKSTLAIYNATASDLVSSDDSKTFTVEKISIEEAYFSPL